MRASTHSQRLEVNTKSMKESRNRCERLSGKADQAIKANTVQLFRIRQGQRIQEHGKN